MLPFFYLPIHGQTQNSIYDLTNHDRLCYATEDSDFFSLWMLHSFVPYSLVNLKTCKEPNKTKTKDRSFTWRICGSSDENLFSTLWYSMGALSRRTLGFVICCLIFLWATFLVQTMPLIIHVLDFVPPGTYNTIEHLHFIYKLLYIIQVNHHFFLTARAKTLIRKHI